MTKRAPERAGDLPFILSVETTCRLLGISRSAGYRAAATGGLPTLHLGRRVHVPTGHLLGLLGMTGSELRERLARLCSEREGALPGRVERTSIRSTGVAG